MNTRLRAPVGPTSAGAGAIPMVGLDVADAVSAGAERGARCRQPLPK